MANEENWNQERYARMDVKELHALAEANDPGAQMDYAYRLHENVDLDDSYGPSEAIGLYRRGLDYLEKASKTFAGKGDVLNAARAEYNLGCMYSEGNKNLYQPFWQDYKKAYESFEGAAEKFSKLGETQALHNTYLNLNTLETKFCALDSVRQQDYYPDRQFSYSNALDYLDKALDCADEQGIEHIQTRLNSVASSFGVKEINLDKSADAKTSLKTLIQDLQHTIENAQTPVQAEVAYDL